MADLHLHRCLNHTAREAVARCPECRQFFCRECITEHDDRVLCAACLKKIAGAGSTRHFPVAWLGALGQCLLGVLAAWLFFYCVGRGLLAMPDSFHEGTFWKAGIMDEE